MRRVILAVVGTVLGLVLILGFKTAPAATRAALPAAAQQPTGGGSTSTGTAPAGSGSTGGSGSSTGSGSGSTSGGSSTAARTVSGQSVDTPYGPVQVQVTVSGKKIADVQARQLPNNDGHSRMIARYAAPVLRQEALSAQSANIDIVSGATFTSQAYAQSLQSALDAAHV